MAKQHICLCILLYFCAVFINVSARCNCGEPNKHYEELGCKPVYDKPDDCCPKRFDCEEIIKRSTNTEKCYYQSKEYQPREQIDNALTQPSCRVNCFCYKSEWEDFRCADIDCPEFLGAFPLKPGCIRLYKPNSCCSSGSACPPFEGLATCKVGDKTYYEGQHFDAPNSECVSCTCLKDFKGKFEEPFCRNLNCNTELKGIQFRNNCAPVYYGNGRCCPISWECQNEEESYQNVGRKLEGTADNNSCRFGNRVLNIGEKFDIDRKYKYSPEINCECIVPPVVTCRQKPHSD